MRCLEIWLHGMRLNVVAGTLWGFVLCTLLNVNKPFGWISLLCTAGGVFLALAYAANASKRHVSRLPSDDEILRTNPGIASAMLVGLIGNWFTPFFAVCLLYAGFGDPFGPSPVPMTARTLGSATGLTVLLGCLYIVWQQRAITSRWRRLVDSTQAG